MLSALHNSLRNIEADAKNQTPEVLAGNMRVLQSHVKEMLSLDGVGMFDPNGKAG